MSSNFDQNQCSSFEIQNDEMSHLINYHPFFKYVDLTDEKWIYFHNHVDSILQNGPTCGLVVLMMADRLVRGETSSQMDLDQLLNEAKELKLTNNGEMFSAKSIEILANQVLKLNASTLGCLKTNQDLIIQNLITGNAILIPYDTDANHEPCLKAGKKAHWCITIGFAFKVSKAKLDELIDDEQLNNEESNIIDLTHSKGLKSADLIRLVNVSSNLNLICKQGKSKHLKLFDFEKLVESNQNLYNVDDSKDRNNFIIPEEGISRTLCDQFVLITR